MPLAASSYYPRIVERRLADMLTRPQAVVLTGAKWVGKTETALRFANTVYELDHPDVMGEVRRRPDLLTEGEPPILIDEWHLYPKAWDLVRRAVDREKVAGRFILTGSAFWPKDARLHGGAGRMRSLDMRPLSLAERQIQQPSVSLADLLGDEVTSISGHSSVRLEDYAFEIVASGLPGVRLGPSDSYRDLLEDYVTFMLMREIEDTTGQTYRRPHLLREWLRSYAGATSTMQTFENIRADAHAGAGTVPSRTTAGQYQSTLAQLCVLEPLAAWERKWPQVGNVVKSATHHLVDPGLAAVMLRASVPVLVGGQWGLAPPQRNRTLFGMLFQSLVTQSVRVYAQTNRAEVSHLRTVTNREMTREVDLLVERWDGKVLAIEVKLSAAVRARHKSHLYWLRERLGPKLLDAVIINTGSEAYRDDDGIAVVPAALLGP